MKFLYEWAKRNPNKINGVTWAVFFWAQTYFNLEDSTGMMIASVLTILTGAAASKKTPPPPQ